MPGTMRCDLSMETLPDGLLVLQKDAHVSAAQCYYVRNSLITAINTCAQAQAAAPSTLVTPAAPATTAVSVEAGAIKDTAAACFFIVPVQVDLTTHVVRDASSSGW